MDIQCEKCRTVFNIDETLIKEGGSKVRCSICRHAFMAYPPVRALEPKETEIPIDPAKRGTDQEIVEELVPLFDKIEESEVKGNDEDLESDLDSVYKDAFQGPAGELAGKMKEESEDNQDLMEDTMVGGEERLTYDPAVDFLAMDNTDDRRDEHERAAESKKKALPKEKSSKWAFIIVLVVILLALLGAVVAINYWKPELIPTPVRSFLSPVSSFLENSVSSFLKAPEKKGPVDTGVRLLEFSSVAGSFVDFEKGGRLFVIRGVVGSKYPKPRSYILIKGNILDNKGKVVMSKQSYAGNTFTKEEIKTLPLEEVKKAMNNRDGMARKNFNLSSGATIPFMIVFDNLPDNLSEFTVEAVSSSPGT
jgi:predicted Zn finger-like uncharacterized protein